MSQPALFSMIIPTFNVAHCFLEALQSITSQTFSDFEIVIIDGGSTDGTLEMIQSKAEEDSRIRWVSEQDEGIYDAMNKGVAMAKGQFLYFLGADDTLYETTTLEQVADYIQKFNLDVVYGNVLSPSFDGPYDGVFTDLKLMRRNICHQAIFVHRKVFNRIGNFSTKYKALGDYHHNIRWFYNTRITHGHMDLIVANYAGDGFSSEHEEPEFFADMSKLLFKEGYKKLPFTSLYNLNEKILKKAKRERNTGEILYRKGMHYYLRILMKLKK